MRFFLSYSVTGVGALVRNLSQLFYVPANGAHIDSNEFFLCCHFDRTIGVCRVSVSICLRKTIFVTCAHAQNLLLFKCFFFLSPVRNVTIFTWFFNSNHAHCSLVAYLLIRRTIFNSYSFRSIRAHAYAVDWMYRPFERVIERNFQSVHMKRHKKEKINLISFIVPLKKAADSNWTTSDCAYFQRPFHFNILINEIWKR